MKKSIVSAIAMLFLLCLSPTVMAGGTPNPNIAVQAANGVETDGTAWGDPNASVIIPLDDNSPTLEVESIETPVATTKFKKIIDESIKFFKSLIKHGQMKTWKLR